MEEIELFNSKITPTINVSNTNPLPPELVEKMKQQLEFNCQPSITSMCAEKCAQIAVDYADDWTKFISKRFDDSVKDLKQQRDELIECLKGVEQMCDSEYRSCENIWRVVHTELKKHES